MGKATQRRERRESTRLGDLARHNPERFKQVWEHRLRAWVQEVYARAFAARDENSAIEDRKPIFGVLAKAERLLKMCGEEAATLVGAQTRAIVENECCKVFARVSAQPKIYRLSNQADNQQLMKSGTHRPPR